MKQATEIFWKSLINSYSEIKNKPRKLINVRQYFKDFMDQIDLIQSNTSNQIYNTNSHYTRYYSKLIKNVKTYTIHTLF